MLSAKNDIKTFVVIDLEVNRLPTYQFNHSAITEICLYAISAKYLKDRDIYRDNSVIAIPELPRILHRLILQVNPRRLINPRSEKLTGLTNEMLEYETFFDTDTAECINYYLARLQKPICLVAHNGWKHDFRVLRCIYEKINMIFPSYVYCVDSFKAFIEIDEKHKEAVKELIKYEQFTKNNNDEDEDEDDDDDEFLRTIEINTNNYEKNSDINWKSFNEGSPDRSINRTETESIYQTFNAEHRNDDNEDDVDKLLRTIEYTEPTISSGTFEQNSQTNWQSFNETTPHRRTNITETKSNKRKFFDEYPNLNSRLKVRRKLFNDNFKSKEKYPRKGSYGLGNIYKRCFKQEANKLHEAEGDVIALSKLILHYGLTFLAYAEEHKVTFDKVPQVGKNTN